MTASNARNAAAVRSALFFGPRERKDMTLAHPIRGAYHGAPPCIGHRDHEPPRQGPLARPPRRRRRHRRDRGDRVDVLGLGSVPFRLRRLLAAGFSVPPMAPAKPTKLVRGLAFALQCAVVWALLELVLFLCGAGRAARILPYQEVALPLFVEQPGSARFTAHEARLGTQVFEVRKPAGLTRIFVLGGSSVRGLGYSPNASFPAYLERVLEHEGYPDRSFEVVNCGIVGISSDQEREMCADIVARYAPDLILVCSGNNEFLELHARLYDELHRSTLRAAFEGTLGRLRTIRFVRGMLVKPKLVLGPDAKEGVQLTATEFIAEVKVTPELYRSRVARYRENLEAIASTCRDARVPLVLMTVPANLRWNDPRPEPDWETKLLEEWSVPRDQWPAEGPERSRFVLAGLEARRAGGSMGEFELAFLRGKCLEALGRIAEAREAYVAAMDLDLRYRRTTSAFNRGVIEVAQRRGVSLVETREAWGALAELPAYRSF